MTIIVFLIVLSILVLIHEFGHFIVAKKLGIKVEEFGFGFPPKLFSRKKGETEYSFNALPFGGFVKLYGEDEAGAGRIQVQRSKINSDSIGIKDQSSNLERAFFARPAWQRISVILAGVVMNAVLAVVIFYAYLLVANFRVEIPLLSDYKFFGVEQTNKVDIFIRDVIKGSPAANSGIKPFSQVLTVNGKKIKSVDDFVNIINSNKGKQIEIQLLDSSNNKNYVVKAAPRITFPKDQGALGVGIGGIESAVLSYDTPYQKVFSGIVHPVNLLVYNFDVMAKLIGISIQEKTVEPIGGTVSGPVGIFKVFEAVLDIQNIKERILQVLNLAGILSISLAFFNVLPIPALDGGRLFFILIEVVSGRKIPQKYESVAHTIGFAVLMALIILITFKDIKQFFL